MPTVNAPVSFAILNVTDTERRIVGVCNGLTAAFGKKMQTGKELTLPQPMQGYLLKYSGLL